MVNDRSIVDIFSILAFHTIKLCQGAVFRVNESQVSFPIPTIIDFTNVSFQSECVGLFIFIFKQFFYGSPLEIGVGREDKCFFTVRTEIEGKILTNVT